MPLFWYIKGCNMVGIDDMMWGIVKSGSAWPWGFLCGNCLAFQLASGLSFTKQLKLRSTQNVSPRCWPQFYCYCTVVLTASETWTVSLHWQTMLLFSGSSIEFSIWDWNLEFEHDLDSSRFMNAKPGSTLSVNKQMNVS